MLGFAPISATALSSVPGFFAFAAAGECALTVVDAATFRLCAASYEFITRSTDTPTNTSFIGTLEKPISFQRSINNGDSGFGGVSAGYGELELINAEADYDPYIDNYAIDGQRVLLKVGSRGGSLVDAYANFVTVSDLTATGWLIGEDVVRISLRDNAFKLEVATQPHTYGGTGNLDGGSDLARKRKPMALGQVRNVSPAKVIPAELVYQVHDGSVNAITAVYDTAVALTFVADYADSTTLRGIPAASLVPGQYATCKAEGLFRLGGAPQGKVAADVQGQNSGGYIVKTADIVKFLVKNACGLSDSDFDLLTIDTLNTLQGATIGYYIDPESNETVAETLAKLMGAIGGWAGFTRLGLFEVRRFDAPGIAPVERYDQYDYLSPVATDRLPSGIDPIVRRIRVTYDYNWTIQQGTEIAGTVSENNPALASYLASQYRVASPSVDNSAVILARHPLAHDPDPVVAYFANFADAQAECDRRMTLYGVERKLYRFAVKDHLLGQDVGDTIFISEPRLGLSGGKFLRVVAANDDLDKNESEIVGFG